LISIKTPRTTKTAPPKRRSQTGDTYRDTRSPPRTASADVATSASAEPANTTHFDFDSAESESAASCVLSPSSATKIAPKVVAKSFQSMRGA